MPGTNPYERGRAPNLIPAPNLCRLGMACAVRLRLERRRGEVHLVLRVEIEALDSLATHPVVGVEHQGDDGHVLADELIDLAELGLALLLVVGESSPQHLEVHIFFQ